MNKKNQSDIEEAKARLKKAKGKIGKKHRSSKEEEPDSLVSGCLDEVELKRRDKRENINE